MKKNLLKILFLVNDRSRFVFGDSNVARTGLSGIGFPSARIEQMIEIIPTMPLPFHCDYAVMTFSVSHINFLKKGRIEELVKLYKDMRNLLMSRFQYIIIIGARPGKYFNLQKIRNITNQLQNELKDDAQFIVVDIFENAEMLKEFHQKNRNDHIHYNENEKIIFQKILDDVIEHHDFKKESRADRAKIIRIQKDPIKMIGVANKLIKKTNTTNTKNLYIKYEGKRFINNSEKNRHTSKKNMQISLTNDIKKK